MTTQSPRLYEKKKGENERYVCLSHRWGGDRIITTTQATLAQRLHSIPIPDMPQTFQDAVYITKSLGYKYLWIDSLCILQDSNDKSDWAREAGKMGSYYRNADLTLVAAAATSSESGCFPRDGEISTRDRFPCELGTFQVDHMCDKSHGNRHTVKLFAAETPAQLFESAAVDGPRRRGPLDTRGWVLQEEILAARSLVFTEQGIQWECIESFATERQPEDAPWSHTVKVARSDIKFVFRDSSYARRFKRLLLGVQDDFTEEIHPLQGPLDVPTLDDTWRLTMENFSARDLTVESDRMPAIEGLIQVVKKAAGNQSVISDCVWGIWNIRHLLWQVADTEELLIEPCDCPKMSGQAKTVFNRSRRNKRLLDAPTWSWVHVNQKVIYKGIFKTQMIDDFDTLVKVLDTTHSGRLTMKGSIKAVLTARKSVSYAKPDISFASKSSDEIATILSSDKAISSEIDEFFPDELNWNPSRAMCMPIQEAGLESLPEGEEKVLQCLLLQPTEDCFLVNEASRNLEFRRIGMANLGLVWRSYFGLDFGTARRQVVISII